MNRDRIWSSPMPGPAGSRARCTVLCQDQQGVEPGVRSYARTSREYRTKGNNKGQDKLV
ncbi:hypothetical protein P280DRAFT_144889 [Massarina eburnea CBS 473.64]|uniref:Uncharacterized protein n=1 Tax=Massarina eburnea CBS 473.64 TaxID=1395130 RepID=A0A6A6RRS5_9PLEO|nr:hypothetical protein P280DRAFT_144889 [Massarina eburnea CBS 473.64]